MCGRNFADDRIEKHEEICAKTAEKAKKRKVFDMTKARVKGTDAAKYVKSAAHLEKKEAKEQKKSDWRKKREDFIATLRAAKEAQKHLAAGGSLKDLPPPPPMDTSDYIQCPHCSRRFAEAMAVNAAAWPLASCSSWNMSLAALAASAFLWASSLKRFHAGTFLASAMVLHFLYSS